MCENKDLRKTWFEGLSQEDAVKAESCLQIVFEGMAIAGGLYYDEVIAVIKAKNEFKEITNLSAKKVVEEFVEKGYCYGNNYLPDEYFKD